MQRTKRGWATIAILAGPLGVSLARLHVIGPNPGTFFALGVLATLSVGGIVYGIKEGVRVARSRELIGN